MNFLSAGWAAAGLLAVPILLLYLLKMRRRPVEVSSTMLWGQVLADIRANTPFQKLRRNLLLILQLLTLAILVLALCQPVVRASGLGGAQTVVIVDASASMQADDAPGNRTRFEQAVRQAERLIDSLRTHDRMMLIVAGPPGMGARSAFSADKGELRRLLRGARPFDAPAAVEEALRLAASSLTSAQAGGGLRGRVYLLSDGVGVSIPALPGLAEALEYVRMGATDQNLGIVGLSVEPGEGGNQRVLVNVANPTGTEQTVHVNFAFGSESHWIDTHQLVVPAGGRASTLLEAPLPPGRLWVTLRGPEDVLAVDSTGYVLLAEPRRLRVQLITEGNPVLEPLLSAAQDNGMVQATVVRPGQAGQAEPADVTIYDSVPVPPALPAGEVVLINPPGQAGAFRRTGTLSRPAVTNIRSEADELRFVNLADLAIAESGQYAHDGSAVLLAESGPWPLLAYADRPGGRQYLVAFHLADSTWATDVGLLIFVSNLLDRARAAHFVGQAQMVPTGQPARLPPGTEPVTVTDPAGKTHTLTPDAQAFAATGRAGFYTVHRGDTETAFAANLLSETETDLAPRALATTAGAAIAQQDDVIRTDRPLWPWLALAAALALMVEWYCYHRRVA